jgi:hypothetical protein
MAFYEIMDDAQLQEAYLDGDDNAWRELFRRNLDSQYNVEA